MNQFWRKFYVRMAEADGGEGGGSGAGGGEGGDAHSGTNDDHGAGSADAGGTALAQAGASQTPAPTIPEKYQVKKDDGTLDVEASSLKLAEAYGNLEKRIGTGDLPPKTAEEYQVAVPDALKDQWNPKEDPLLSGFLKDAHAAGFTQKQVDLAMGKYFELAPQLLEGNKQLSADECVANLKTEWKTDEVYTAEVSKAFKAAQAYGDKDAEAIVKDYGNDPRIIRLLARVGAEMGEDSSINPGGSMPAGQTVETLMTSEAYSNPKHPDHARVSAQVQSYFDGQAKSAARAGNAPIL